MRLKEALIHLGVERVEISFDGSGDSGSIDCVTFTPKLPVEEHILPKVSITRTTSSYDPNTREYTKHTVEEDMSIVEAVEHFTYDWLESTGVDWYNNEGGYGSVYINVENGTVTFDAKVYYRIIEDVLGADAVDEELDT